MSLRSQTTMARPLWQAAMPGLFVLLWGSGFVFTKLGVAFAEPFTFLLIRFVVTAALLLLLSLLTAAPWPRDMLGAAHIVVVGVFLQATYLGGVYAAIAEGISPGLCALIVGLQPIVTGVVVGLFLGERVTPRQWLGLALGFAGVTLVLWDKLGFATGYGAGIAWNVLGLIGITVGTLYQKRFYGTMDWRSGGFVQYAAAAVMVLPGSLLLETRHVEWTWELILTYLWLIFVLSIGAVSLLGWLIRRGAAAEVVSLFYLVPPAAALGSWLLFGETLGCRRSPAWRWRRSASPS
jgi:drug/metabolite transporter (DMT)-like permease